MSDRQEDEEEYFGDQEEDLGEKGSALGEHLEDHFSGDNRFAVVELAVPGFSDEESFHLQLTVDSQTRFFIALLSEGMAVRVGISTDDESVGEALEAAVHDHGDSITEFLEGAVEGGDELDYEVHHLEDDIYAYCADIPFDSPAQLNSHGYIEQVIYYLDAFAAAFSPHLEQGDGGS